MVVGGVHGNEVIGARVINELIQNPIPNTDWVIANPKALAQGGRFIDQNLAFAFAHKHRTPHYESRRAEEVVELCAPYDLIIDVHDTESPHCEYVAINDQSHPSVLAVASIMGLRRVIYSRYGIASRNPNAITLEFNRCGEKNREAGVERVLGGLATIATMSHLPVIDMNSLDFYRRITEISGEYAEKLGLLDTANEVPFDPLPIEVNRQLGLPSDLTLYSEYWGLTGDWFGSLLIKDGPPTKTARMP